MRIRIMADAAVDALITRGVPLLVSQFLKQIDLGFGFDDPFVERIPEIKERLVELESIRNDVEAGIHEVRWRHLIRDIRDVSYRFDNLLEALIIKNGGDVSSMYSPQMHTARCIPIFFLMRWSLSLEQSFSEIFSAIEQIFLKLQSLRENPISNIFSPEELGSGYYGAYVFVGRKEEKVRLLSYLSSNDVGGAGQVIAISGMCGVGKTRLAQQLFEHIDTEKVWIRVPHKYFRRQYILEEIIEKLGLHTDPSVFDKAEQELATMISSYLENNRVLIVLDDICSMDIWESLKVILPNNSSFSSKILITTRMKKVAESAAAARWIQMTRLTNQEGCELVAKNAPDFLGDIIQRDLGKNIVNFCGSIPLTICSFLRCMETKKTVEAWNEMVNETRNSVFSKRLEIPEFRKLLEVVASTYHELPHEIKPFFLYMGVLQQDIRVEVEKLYLMCLADGILKPLQRGGERLVDVAERSVTEVAERIMFDLEEEEEPAITRIKYCKLSGLMLDLSLLKNKDEGYINVVRFANPSPVVLDSSSSSSSPGFRTFRAAINCDDYEEGSKISLDDDDMMHIRVLLFNAQKKLRVWPGEFSRLLVKSKYLRVLDFNGFDFRQTKLPKGLGRAVHLRYLSFKDCILHKLPSWVAKLKFLCILDLRVQQVATMIIPNVLWKMKKLCHLYFPLLFKTAKGSKLRLHGLTEVETITNFSAWMFNVEDLFGLPKLQYLHAIVDGDLEGFEPIINRMRMRINSDVPLLRTSLDIRNFDCYTEKRHSIFRELLACQSLTVLSVEGYLRRMPMFHHFSGNLTKIVLVGSEMIEDPIKILEKLPKLNVLVLDDAFAGEEMVCSASGFVELKLLKLLNLRFLKKWIVEDGALPELSILAIADCGQLEMLPQGLQRLNGLREIQVLKMPKDIGNGFEHLIRLL